MKSLAILLLLFPFLVEAADPSQPSGAILKQRDQAQGELQFTYRKSAGGHEETIGLGLAADYDYIDAGGVRTIRDYKLRRLLTIRATNGGYVDNSLYALVWHRVAEMQNRANLMKMLASAKIDTAKLPPASSDPFWMESELGVINPALPRPEIARHDEGGWSRWTLKGDEVAAVKFKAEAVPAALQPGLRRFWAEMLPLHPSIIEAVAASGRLPEEMRFRTLSPKGEQAEAHWLLTDLKWVPAARYPLAAGLKAEPAEMGGAFPEIFRTLAGYVADRRIPPAEAIYAAKARASIDRGAGLEAMLWLLEMQLASGSPGPTNCQTPGNPNPFCQLAPLAAQAAKTDPRFAMTFGPQSPGLADRRKFDDLPNGYLPVLLFATKAAPQDVTFADNEKGLLAAIKAVPIANFCKDASDFYLRNWNPMAAWQISDLGRSMAGHRSGDLLTQIDMLETNLARTAPQFF